MLELSMKLELLLGEHKSAAVTAEESALVNLLHMVLIGVAALNLDPADSA